MRKVHKYDVWQIILLPVMKKMISTGKNKSISAYDIEANKLSRLKLKESLQSITMIANTDLLLVVDELHAVKIYDTEKL